MQTTIMFCQYFSGLTFGTITNLIVFTSIMMISNIAGIKFRQKAVSDTNIIKSVCQDISS